MIHRTAGERRPLAPLALAALMALGAAPAQSAIRYFTGSTPYWDLDTNWGGLLPGAADDVQLDIHQFNGSILARDTEVRAAITVRSFTGTGKLTLSADPSPLGLSFAAASSIGSLDLKGRELTGAGALTVSGAVTWSAGFLSGTGSTLFKSGVAITGPMSKGLRQRSLTLAGNSSWSGNGAFNLIDGAVLTLDAGQSFTDQNTDATAMVSGGGLGSAFVNLGSYIKAGKGTTTLQTAFTNTGALAVNAGTLTLYYGAGGSGSITVAKDATLRLGASTASGTLVNNDGSLALTAGLLDLRAGISGIGDVGISGQSQLNLGAASSMGSLHFEGTALSSNGDLTVDQASSWSRGIMSGVGTTTFNGGLAIGAYGGLDGRQLTLAGASSWFKSLTANKRLPLSNGAVLTNNGSFDDTSAGNGSVIDGGGAGNRFVNTGTYIKSGEDLTTIGTAFSNSGKLALNAGRLILNGAITWSGNSEIVNPGNLVLGADSRWSGGSSIALSGDGVLTNGAGRTFEDMNIGAAAMTRSGATGNDFVNAGTYAKTGPGTTTFSTFFDNSGGTLAVSDGALRLEAGLGGNGGKVDIVAGSLYAGLAAKVGALSLSGGELKVGASLKVGEASSWAGGAISGGGTTTFNDALLLDGSNRTLSQGTTVELKGNSSWLAGGITLGDSAVLWNRGSFADKSVNAVIDTAGTGGRFDNVGSYTKSGIGTTTINAAFVNSGSLKVDQGRLTLNRGVNGSGNVAVASGAALVLGAGSATRSLSNLGTLTLGANIAVLDDYNANFGAGNAFDRRAGVTGSGLILAQGPGTVQALAGERITGGNTANAVLALPNLRVGDAAVTTSFTIRNAGSAGPSLRGAIQTTGLTTTALSGTGATAQNWGALAAGTATAAYTLTYSPTAASTGLAGQSLAIVNNFDNVAGQTLSFTGGKVYAPAVAQLGSSTLDFGIVHVGDTVSRGIAVGNGAAVAALNDQLRGTASGGGGAFTVGGSLAGVQAGAQDGSSLTARLDTAQAGIYTGTADLAFTSDNTDLGSLALAGGQVALRAQVNHYAALGLSQSGGAGSFSGSGNRYTLDFGTLKLGDAGLSTELKAANVATGLADVLGLQFDLGTASGHFALTGFGTIGGLGAGQSQGGLQISFSGLLAGSFDDVITLHATGSNASGYAGALGDVQLRLVGNVAAVPEPATWAQLALGLAGLVGLTRRRRAGARAQH